MSEGHSADLSSYPLTIAEEAGGCHETIMELRPVSTERPLGEEGTFTAKTK